MRGLLGAMRLLSALAGVAVLAGGCASLRTSEHRLARYRPDVEDARLPWPAAVAAPAGTNQPAPAPELAQEGLLRKGDRVVISRRDIPREDEIKDVIDQAGEVNLPLIGTVRLAGKTTSEAENLIEGAYINGGFYKKINIIVIAQEDEYFISGEVTRPGKYSLSPGMTLLRAVAVAGGCTDFANLKKISIYRGDKVFVYDATRIESLREADPRVYPEDKIVVARKWIL